MTFVNRYSRTDRLLHRLAFSSQGIQLSLADIEDRVYKNQLAGITIDRPVFITALPRAGTTMLLNLLHATGEFFGHTYREMPFVLCPVLWHHLSQHFRVHDSENMERAHGDGVTISDDSAEAFEEIIWRQFWPAHYRNDRIEPWRGCNDFDFVEFFNSHLRKLAWLKQTGTEQNPRYISKNNLNVARLAGLNSIFPDAVFVIPFREPLQHASSLLNQHLGFLHAHKNDTFAKEYMRGIGHYDFGENLLPVNFGHWLNSDRRADALELPFWIEYWIVTYSHILSLAKKSVHLLPYDQLVCNSTAGMEWLAAAIDIRNPAALGRQADTIRKARNHEIDTIAVNGDLLVRANNLFSQLKEASSFKG